MGTHLSRTGGFSPGGPIPGGGRRREDGMGVHLKGTQRNAVANTKI